MSEVSTGAGLLPCPFCGGQATKQEDHWRDGNLCGGAPFCKKCGTQMPRYWPQRETAEAIAAWNKRATPKPADDLVERGWLIEFPWTKHSGGALQYAALAKGKWPRYNTIRRTRLVEHDEYQTPIEMVADSNDAIRFARKEDAEAFVVLFDRFLLHPVIAEHQWIGPDIAAIPDRAALVGEVESLRLSNSLLEQFRKSDLEEITTLRTQLAASRADVARLRGAMADMANQINIVGSHYNQAQEALDGIVADVKSRARAAIRDTQP